MKTVAQKQVEISVIIPAYNAEQFLERAVESVCVQEGLAWELLMIENGSTDRTADIGRKLAKNDNRIHFFQSEKGVCRARNLGLDQANGKWTSFLDADDYLYPDAFQSLCEMILCGADSEKTEDYDLVLFGHNSGENSTQ